MCIHYLLLASLSVQRQLAIKSHENESVRFWDNTTHEDISAP